jgi:hypothetical protein
VNAIFPKLSRNAWLTACSAVVFALAFAGCGGDGDAQQREEPRIEPSAATALAATSDEIALLIEEGKVCDAAHKADELLAAATAEIEKGTVPPALAGELETNARALQDQVNCEAPLPPPPPPDDGEEDKEKDEEEKEKGKDKEKKD